MADKYFRLVTVIVNVCPVPLRVLFTDMAKKESTKTGVSFTDIDNFLKQQSTKVLANSRFTRDQLNLLYPKPPCKAKVIDWDVTLLSLLLETLFGTVLGPAVITCFKNLRKVRNELQHKATTLSVTDADFQQYMKDITTETANVAKVAGGSKFEKEIRAEIMNVENSFMPTLGGVLLKWYNSIILETKVNTDHIKEDTQEMRALLEGTAVKRKRRSGPDLSHFRSLNNVQDALIRNFKITKNAYKDTDFSPPERAMSKISKRMSDQNFAIITGHGNSKYLHVAVSAIHRLSIEDVFCAELHRPEELFSINGEEVGLLLLRSSFLSKLLTKGKDFIVYTLNRLKFHISHCDNPLKVVMLSDKLVFEKFKDQYQHELLTTAINVDTPTSSDDPEDLTHYDLDEQSDTARNMLAWSNLFLQEREMIFNDEDFLKKAEEIFRQQNFVVCVGELACGRSALAVHLAKLNRSHACIVVTEPDEFKYVELGKTDILVILDFAGRFRYDEAKVFKWLEKFDLIYDAVQNGILSVIITCQESRLRMCRDEAASHIILEQTIHIPKNLTITTKKESRQKTVLSGGDGNSLACNQNMPERSDLDNEDHEDFALTNDIIGQTVDDNQDIEINPEDNSGQGQVCKHTANGISSQITHSEAATNQSSTFSPPSEKVDVEFKHHNISKNDLGDDHDSCVWGICQLPDKTFVLLDYYKQLIKQFDVYFKFMKHMSVQGSAKDICCTGNNQITIAFDKSLTVFNVKSEKCSSLQIDISPDMLSSNMKQLFVMDKANRIMHEYNLDRYTFVRAIHVPVVETYSPAFCNSLCVSTSGERFYIMYLNMIKCLNKYGVLLATYEMPLQKETRKNRKFTETVMCLAGDDVLIFIAQGNKFQTKEQFIFLDSSLNEIQRGDIKSDNQNIPSVMCFDKFAKRAILGYKRGSLVTEVNFRKKNANMQASPV